MCRWWSRSTRVRPLTVSYPVWSSFRYSHAASVMTAGWRSVQKGNRIFLAAEPSLGSRGSRPRASSRRTCAGHVCGAWREDVSHRSADGGPGARIRHFHHYELLLNKFLLTQGKVVALDRIRNKIDRIVENAQALQLRSIKAFCFNSTQAVSGDAAPQAEGMNIWSFQALF